MRIGTRGSALALWQARTVARLIASTGGPACEIVVIRTSGDESAGPPDAPRQAPCPSARGLQTSTQCTQAAMNVKRLFVKEIEDALLDGRVDLAVHSSKDLPAELPDGLRIAAALEREDPRDALVLPSAAYGARPRRGGGGAGRSRRASARAACAARRSCARRFPGATFIPIRGNVDTRLRKLDAGECDVLVLAAAGLKRLGLEARISALLPVDVCVPAPGQGIVAVEIADGARRPIAGRGRRASPMPTR